MMLDWWILLDYSYGAVQNVDFKRFIEPKGKVLIEKRKIEWKYISSARTFIKTKMYYAYYITEIWMTYSYFKEYFIYLKSKINLNSFLTIDLMFNEQILFGSSSNW